MALIIDIADAVTEQLNTAAPGTFAMAFTAVRRVLPEFELSDLTTLQVSVVPKASETQGSTRAASQFDLQTDIGVQKKLGLDLEAQVEDLCGLVDQIADYLRRRELTSLPGVRWVQTSNDPVYVPEHLAQQRVFTSVLTLTYRAIG